MNNAANAAAAAAAAAGLQVPTAVSPSSFHAYYNDAGQDEYRGNYGGLMGEFDAMAGRAPGDLRTLASSNPISSVGYLYLIRAPNAPDHPQSLQ